MYIVKNRKIMIDPTPRMGDCKLCGQYADLRPYGPNGEEICIDCGLKHPITTKQKALESAKKAMDEAGIA